MGIIMATADLDVQILSSSKESLLLTQKEFYFVRHGQTDGNVATIRQDYGDIPLNPTGREQARIIEPLIANLPIKSVYCSPLKRAKETRDIACMNLRTAHAELAELSECSKQVWQEMTRLGKMAREETTEPVYSFMRTILKGLNLALSCEGPVLIVAHGGVHWATCCLMEIDQHDWIVENCGVIHFYVKGDGTWAAKKLNG
jgi:probable phosphoglycerate mutase